MNTNRLVRLLKIAFPWASRTEVKLFIRWKIKEDYLKILSDNTIFLKQKWVTKRIRYNATIEFEKNSLDNPNHYNTY